MKRLLGGRAQNEAQQDAHGGPGLNRKKFSLASALRGNVGFYEFFAHTYADLFSALDAGETVRQWLILLRGISLGLIPGPHHHPKLLDVGCGPGCHLAHWVAAGYNAAGLDSSPRMLALARATLHAAGADRVPLYQVNLVDSDLPTQVGGPYDLLVSHTNFAQIFAPQQLKQVSGCLASISKPGSLWMMDLTSPAVAADRASDSFTDAEGKKWTAIGTRRANGREYHLAWKNDQTRRVERYWLHGVEEIDTLLSSSGWFRAALRSWHPQDFGAPWRRANNRSKRMVLLYEQRRPKRCAQQSVGNNAL